MDKQVGIVQDYRDEFDDGLRQAAKERFRVYESLRWEQFVNRDDQLSPISG